MSLARTADAIDATNLGTSESSLSAAIASNATVTGAEKDVLGDDTSIGDVRWYLVLTSTVTAGSVDVTICPRRVSGQAYTPRSVTFSVAPSNGTQYLYLGDTSASRYMNVIVKNNGTGANCTVFVGYELYKVA